MTNEQLVTLIQQGVNTTENIEKIYKNLSRLTHSVLKPYARMCELDDLIQECFFTLINSIETYDAAQNMRFSTYYAQNVRFTAYKYCYEHGYAVRLPQYLYEQLVKYRNFFNAYYLDKGKAPTDEETQAALNITQEQLEHIIKISLGVASLDTPIIEDSDNITLADTLQDNTDLENNTLDKIYNDYKAKAVWGVVDDTLQGITKTVIQECYKNNLTVDAISKKLGISFNQAQAQKVKGLKMLKRARAKQRLQRELEYMDSQEYGNSLTAFNNHNFTSGVERHAIDLYTAFNRYNAECNAI